MSNCVRYVLCNCVKMGFLVLASNNSKSVKSILDVFRARNSSSSPDAAGAGAYTVELDG